MIVIYLIALVVAHDERAAFALMLARVFSVEYDTCSRELSID